MQRQALVICGAALGWLMSVSGLSAQMFNTRSAISQPTALQPLQPQRGMTVQGTPSPQLPGNMWNGMPNPGMTPSQTTNVPRSMGRGFPGQAAGAPQAGLLSILQTGRFVRGNRAPDAFVGADARDAAHFVGTEGDTGIATPLAGPLVSALSRAQGALTMAGQQGALSAAAPRATMYAPRLRVDFAHPQPAPQQMEASLTERLESCTELYRLSPIAVSLEGRTAILRGTVASERDRLLAQQLILFEPGISQVKNELQVRSPPASPSEGPAER